MDEMLFKINRLKVGDDLPVHEEITLKKANVNVQVVAIFQPNPAP